MYICNYCFVVTFTKILIVLVFSIDQYNELGAQSKPASRRHDPKVKTFNKQKYNSRMGSEENINNSCHSRLLLKHHQIETNQLFAKILLHYS